MTSGLRQLATIIDRAAYLGTCELLLTPSEISLKGPLEALALCSETMGAILERQVESLEGNLWKEGVREVVKALLLDALSVYSAAIMPIRRARVLIRCLEFGYKAGDQVAGRHADDFGEEAQDLLGREVSDYYLQEVYDAHIILLALRRLHRTRAQHNSALNTVQRCIYG